MTYGNLEHETPPPLPPAIRQQLAALRAGIRRYVWLEGLAAMAVWLGAAFWGSMAIDWIFEPPRPVRGAVLAAAGIGLAVVLFLFILRRAFVRLSDGNMATILERQFPQLNDSLLTSVLSARIARPERQRASIPRCSPTPAIWPSSAWTTCRFPRCSIPCRWCGRSSSPWDWPWRSACLAVMAPERAQPVGRAESALGRDDVAAQDPPGGGGLYRRRGQGGRGREFRSPRAGLPRRYRNTRHSGKGRDPLSRRRRRPRPKDHEEHRPAGNFRRPPRTKCSRNTATRLRACSPRSISTLPAATPVFTTCS